MTQVLRLQQIHVPINEVVYFIAADAHLRWSIVCLSIFGGIAHIVLFHDARLFCATSTIRGGSNNSKDYSQKFMVRTTGGGGGAVPVRPGEYNLSDSDKSSLM